jgi:flagellar motor component MotA
MTEWFAAYLPGFMVGGIVGVMLGLRSIEKRLDAISDQIAMLRAGPRDRHPWE